MGVTDRTIRLLIAVIIVLLWLQDVFTQTGAVVAMILAFIFFATSLIGVCPAYSLFGFDTCAKKKTV
jgi:hypothetical protein